MPPAIPDKINCESATQLVSELDTFQETLNLKETEESWEKISRALQRMTALVKGGAYRYPHELVAGVKSSAIPIKSAMLSERTRLSGTAVDLLVAMAPRLDLNFEPLVSVFLPTVMQLCSRANKIYVARSRAFLEAVTSHTVLTSIIPYLARTCEDKSNTAREVAIDFIFHSLNRFNPPHLIKYAENVESSVRLTGTDKDAAVRSMSRKVFEAYKILWPDRVDQFIAPLTPVIKKYLEIRSRTLSKPAPLPAEIKARLELQERGRARPRRSLSCDAVEPRITRKDVSIEPVQALATKVVPVRRARSQKPPAERIAAESAPVTSTPSPTEQPLPTSKAIIAPPSRSVKPMAPAAPPGEHQQFGPRRVVQAERAVEPTTARAGPVRPVQALKSQPSKANLATSTGPSPVPQEAVSIPDSAAPASQTENDTAPSSGTTTGERRGHGAQRVLLPPKKPMPQEVAPMKPVRPAKIAEQLKGKEDTRAPSRAAAHSRTNSQSTTVSHPPSRAATPAALSSSTNAAKPDDKGKSKQPVPSKIAPKVAPRPNIVKATAKPKPIVSSAIGVAKPKPVLSSATAPATAPKPAPRPPRQGLTAPTLAQLARVKAIETDKPKGPLPKQTAGKGGIPRRGFVPVRGRGRAVTGTSSRLAKQVDPIPEAEVPLPQSPELKAKDVKESVEPIEPLVVVEAKETPNSLDGPEGTDNVAPSVDQPHLEIEEEMLLVDLSTPAPMMHKLAPASPSPDSSRSGSPLLMRQMTKSKRPARDPFSGLTEHLMDVLDQPLPPTPIPTIGVFPPSEIIAEPDDTMLYSESANADEETDDDEMERLEFAFNGVDQFGKVVESPRKLPQTRIREALATVVMNREKRKLEQQQQALLEEAA